MVNVLISGTDCCAGTVATHLADSVGTRDGSRWHLMAPDGTCHTTDICIYLSCSTLGTMNPRRITDRGFLMLNIAKSLLVVTVINHFTATCCNSFEHWLGQAKNAKSWK